MVRNLRLAQSITVSIYTELASFIEPAIIGLNSLFTYLIIGAKIH